MPDGEIGALAARLGRHFTILVDSPETFVRQTRVLPLESAGAVRIDVIFGLLSFEQDAIARAATIELAGAPVKVCTAEDLILMKIVSGRERDLAGARGIIRRRRAQLDYEYLTPRILELSRFLERPDIETRWQRWSSETS